MKGRRAAQQSAPATTRRNSSAAARAARRDFERDHEADAEQDQIAVAGSGFRQYPIKWDNQMCNFTLDVVSHGVKLHFYGWWRQTRFGRAQDEIGYAIDLFCKYEKDGTPYELTVAPLMYANDPRRNMESLNADICAAANQWMFKRLSYNAQTLDDLIQRAKEPTIVINRLETIDRIITQLRDFRDTAIVSGGTRTFTAHGDSGDQKINIRINVTAQAIALEGKPPSLVTGSLADAVLRTRSQNRRGAHDADPDNRPRRLTPTADPANVQALVRKLRDTTDKSEQRKIRGLLRRMGHKGGARNVTE